MKKSLKSIQVSFNKRLNNLKKRKNKSYILIAPKKNHDILCLPKINSYKIHRKTYRRIGKMFRQLSVVNTR